MYMMQGKKNGKYTMDVPTSDSRVQKYSQEKRRTLTQLENM